MSDFDPSSFLDQKHYAIDFRMMMGDIQNFLELSEKTLEWQYRVEVQSIRRRDGEFDNKRESELYTEHLLENAEFRFKNSLPMRVRYAALISLVTAVEWYSTRLKIWALFTMKGDSPVRIIRSFCEHLSIDRDHALVDLQNLITIRDSIVHGAGIKRIKTRHGEPDLTQAVNALPGFNMVDWPFLGECVSIDQGALDRHILDMAALLPELCQAADERNLLQ